MGGVMWSMLDRIKPLLASLQGKKTYVIAAAAIVYVLGGEQGWWTVNEQLLVIAGFGGLATFRSGVKALSAQPQNGNQAVPIHNNTPKVPCLLAGTLLISCIWLTGCASFSTKQIDERNPDGTDRITTITRVRTFLDSKTALANLATSQTEKTQSTKVGTLNQESSGTNAVKFAESVAAAVTAAAIKAAAPTP
jgi:hypothetical protein